MNINLKDYSQSQFNPYYAGAKAIDIFRDDTIYGKKRSFSDLDKVGSTMAGNGLNTLGNAAISSGNPIAMAGGLAAKAIGGAIDVFSYNPEFEPINNRYSSERRNSYDLGGIGSEINDIDPGKAGRNAVKQMGISGLSPLGLWGGLRARKKAKEAKQEALNQFEDAQGRYNTATRNFFEDQSADNYYNQKQLDRINRNVFNIKPNFYEY